MTCGSLLTILLNVDSIEIAKQLWFEPTLRSTVVQNAESFLGETRENATVEESNETNLDSLQSQYASIQSLKNELDQMSLPVGWPQLKNRLQAVPARDRPMILLQTLIGWILTTISVSMGAPFWFNTLEKALNIRNSGNRPQRSEAAPN